MGQTVMIKSSKCGINLVLSPELSFPELLSEIVNRFKESEKFFAKASFAISFASLAPVILSSLVQMVQFTSNTSG